MPSDEDEGDALEIPFENEDADADLLPDNGVEDTQSDSNIGASLSILARARSVTANTDKDDSEKDPETKT